MSDQLEIFRARRQQRSHRPQRHRQESRRWSSSGFTDAIHNWMASTPRPTSSRSATGSAATPRPTASSSGCSTTASRSSAARPTSPGTGTTYQAGSYVVSMSQALARPRLERLGGRHRHRRPGSRSCTRLPRPGATACCGAPTRSRCLATTPLRADDAARSSRANALTGGVRGGVDAPGGLLLRHAQGRA